MPDVGDNDDVPAGAPDTVLVRNSANTNYETRAYSSTNFSGLAADDYVRYDGSDFTNRTRAQVRDDVLLEESAEERMLDLVNSTGANVTYVEIENANTGVGPTLRAAGETNTDLNLDSAGTGTVNINGNPVVDTILTGVADHDQLRYNSGSAAFVNRTRSEIRDDALLDETTEDRMLSLVSGSGSNVNYVEIENEVTGVGPTVRAEGTDTDVDININSKNDGNIILDGLIVQPVSIVAPTDGGLLTFNEEPAGASAYVELPGGDDGEVLTMVSGRPAWTGSGERHAPLSWEGVSAGDRKTILVANGAITITRVRAVVRGTNPDVTWTIYHNTDHSNPTGATELIAGGTQTSSETTGDDVTAFDTGASAVAAGAWVWVEALALETDATIDELFLQVFYTIDR